MARFAMVIDQERCVGCQSCTVACRSEWDVPVGFTRTAVRPAGVRGSYPAFSSVFHVSQCNHCERPTCLPVCPTGATYQEPNGIVRVDKQLCIGCGSCVPACPYGARFIDSAKGVVDKCDFCAARAEQHPDPACVSTCPAKAKIFGDLEDSNSAVFNMVYRQGARRMEEGASAIGPNVYYLGSNEHFEMAAAAFPAEKPRTIAPLKVWGALVKKVVVFAVGLTFAGQAIAFFRQLSVGEKQFDE